MIKYKLLAREGLFKAAPIIEKAARGIKRLTFGIYYHR